MPRRLVCISSTDAATGAQVGLAVANALGFRYVDEQIIARAAELAQVEPAVVAAAEKRQPLLDRILDKLAVAQELAGPIALGTMLPVGGGFAEYMPARSAPDDLRVLIRAAILEVAKEGQAVIVAHGASMAVEFHEGVLRVLITASLETRIRRLVVGGMKEAEATTAIAQSDKGRRAYFRKFFEIREELPTHYDLVVNTDTLGAEQVAAIVVSAARADA
jgi:cytidylate kinase